MTAWPDIERQTWATLATEWHVWLDRLRDERDRQNGPHVGVSATADPRPAPRGATPPPKLFQPDKVMEVER